MTERGEGTSEIESKRLAFLKQIRPPIPKGESMIQQTLALMSESVSLDAPLEDTAEPRTLRDIIPDSGLSVEDRVLRNFVAEEIRRHVDSLPPLQSEALKLYYGFEDSIVRTEEEVGQIMGATRQATHNRLARGRGSLKKNLIKAKIV